MGIKGGTLITILLSFMVLLCGCAGQDASTESKANTAQAEGQVSGAEDVPYSVLVNDPGQYSGRIIHITGKISSISAEDAGYIILVSTEKQVTGDYEGDKYSVLVNRNSASVSLGEIVDIKGKFTGIGDSGGLPEITSLDYGLIYSRSEHLRMVDQIKSENKAVSKESTAEDLSENISGISDNNINSVTQNPSLSGSYVSPSNTPAPVYTAKPFSSGISSDNSLASSYSSGTCQPGYRAGMVIADRDENLKIVTVCNTVTGKYCTRSLMKSTEGDAYLLKDSSFMELGSQYDYFSSIEEKYPTLYDDLSENTRDSEYNYIKKSGSRIYIRVKENNNLKGYLAPDSAEKMKHIVI